MKKILVVTAVLGAFAGSAFAASVPVTNIYPGETKIQAEYSITNKTANDSKRRNGFGVCRTRIEQYNSSAIFFQ